jgi:hypothetical protein
VVSASFDDCKATISFQQGDHCRPGSFRRLARDGRHRMRPATLPG